MNRRTANRLLAALLASTVTMGSVSMAFADVTILNVSYDPTRELYKEFNDVFAAKWKADTGETVTIQTSHGGSGKQARAVIDGLDADVVTLALESDINTIAAKSGKIPADWRAKLPNNSSPYTSTIVFLVRKGNPKAINNWGDLVKDGVEVITPNPKTSGGARWNYLAAWAWAHKEYRRRRSQGEGLYCHVCSNMFRCSTPAHAARPPRLHSVKSAMYSLHGKMKPISRWMNSALTNSILLCPPQSMLAEPPVAVVDVNVDAKGTRKVAEAYLNFLYSDEGQKLALKHHYRPSKT